ncbi:MAG: class F420-dependent oxidoreductase, partial [Acidimicrobiales bacterium]|nr:class F420-dependent oxidoreductase [Acidimicrobiales bacterium]
DLYLDGKKDEAAAKVPAELLEATTLCGPAGYVKERLAAYEASGVTHLNVIPIPQGGQTQADVVSQLKEWTS